MDNVDLKRTISSYSKGRKIGLTFFIVFAAFDVIAIALFIAFASWKTQLETCLIGSATCSLLSIVALAFFFSIYQPNNERYRFYKDLLMLEESETEEKIVTASEHKQTQRKGIVCFCVKSETREYCLLPESAETLKEGVSYKLTTRGKYIVRAEIHED
ncbi:MAG: hypothetical protein MJ239_04085 [Bacilli bacterium]|nr:hypothetical protein [Bacilli bacterium]